jgi:hypothetical protein
MDNRTNNYLQNRKLKIEKQESHWNTGVNLCTPEE